jgi:tetratricopeptide (TPR) repeat protein
MTRATRLLLLLLLLVLPAPAAMAAEGADGHMLAGARYFQAGHFTEALVEFRVAEKAGEDGAAWYVAATLVKLKRPEDALEEFTRAAAAAPGDRDALLDYYRALACYDARLYFCADRLLASIGEQPGPRIAAQARKIRADLGPVLAAAPSDAAIDWYHARGQAALAVGRAELAAGYFEEAISLAGARPDGHRRGEALAGLARARQASARSGPGAAR